MISNHFKNLSEEEIKNTHRFFRDFFSFLSLDEWRLMFSRIVEYAYSHYTIDEVLQDGSSMVLIREYIEKLIEVIYLIYNTQTVLYVNDDTTVN